MRKAFVALVTVGMLFALVPAAAAAPPAHAGKPSMTPPMHAGRLLTATLSGASEVPGPGDPDGTGKAYLWLNQGQGRICFKLMFDKIAAPTAAHIHIGKAGQSGGVAVGLSTGATFKAEGCTTGVAKDVIKDIRQNPQNYYVNIHNSVYPAGAIRGQLSK